MTRFYRTTIKTFTGLLTLLVGFTGNSQIVNRDTVMIVKGGTFFVNNGAQVGVRGTFLNQNPNVANDPLVDVRVVGNGLLYVEGNLVNNWNFGKPAEANDGEIYVGGDWINNDTFWAGNGFVYFGNPTIPNPGSVPNPPISEPNQFISGSRPTTFSTIVLREPGIKTLKIDQNVTKTLSLENSELYLQLHNMNILNPQANLGVLDPSPNLGFVSDSSNADNSIYGKLIRATDDAASTYLFPMGDRGQNGAPPRYRPVQLKPSGNAPNRYAVSFFNFSPANFGYNPSVFDDTTICSVNPNYFWNITREDGIDDANIALTFDTISDGFYSGVVNWRTFPSPDEWKNTGGPFPLGLLSGATGVLRTVTKVGNFDWNFRRFNIGTVAPNTPVVYGTPATCAGFPISLYIDPVTPGAVANWTVNPGTIIGSSSDNPVSVSLIDTTATFDPTVATITVTENLLGCTSLPATFTTSILSNPDANFTVVTPYSSGNFNPNVGDTSVIFTYDMLQFDNTSQNAQSYYWEFGNGANSVIESPFQFYEGIGDFTIMLVATSPDGCLDTIYQTVKVQEGTTIPNVFTPNNDGVNDIFFVRNSDVTEYSLSIYNRWGILVFQTTSPQVKWDGNTISGQPATSGTYYWVLSAKYGSGNEYQGEKKGYVELVRN